ncbi:helix-hairpin-helix domain-containing protein [Streptomyces sp. NPDC048270]
MTLRTRTPHPSGATSGPGRTRLSDGRLRHRRGPGLRGGHRPPQADPEAVRRRAEALLGSTSPPPPPEPQPGPPPEAEPGPVAGAEPGSSPEVEPGPPPERDPGPVVGAGPGSSPEVEPGLLPERGPGPVAGAGPAALSGAEPAVGDGAGSGAPDVAEPRSPAGERAGLEPGVARRLALRERMPVWLQARCAVEPRTVAAVGVVLVVAVGLAAQQFWSARPRPVTAPAVIAPAAVPTPQAPAGAPTRIVVDIGGKVRDPGVRRLPAGSRVEDALAAAGGVRPGTDTTGLNRARVLVDGEQVLVGAPAPPPPDGGGAGGSDRPSTGPLSLGSATVEQLDGLPGVGPVLAQHIVDFRTARGGFRSVEELRQVNGIGERRFADLRTLVRP